MSNPSPAIVALTLKLNRCVYKGHTDGIADLSWSPDGKYIATASDDESVQIWNVATGTTLLTYWGHQTEFEPCKGVRLIAWSPDGQFMASQGGDDNTIHIWDTAKGNDVLSYNGHRLFPWTLDWSLDSKFIASGGSEDGAVLVWESATGNTVRSYYGHWSPSSTVSSVHIVAWSPDGKQIASSGGEDEAVHVWNVTNGKQSIVYGGHRDYPGPRKRIRTLSWSSDGKCIASVDSYSTVQVWDVATGATISTYQGSFLQEHIAITWSSNKICIASAENSVVQVWDSSAKSKWNYYGHFNGRKSNRVCALGWSPDGKNIASADSDGVVYIWQAR